jgi:hypothetical protein
MKLIVLTNTLLKSANTNFRYQFDNLVCICVALFVFESIMVQQYDYQSQMLQCHESYVFVISNN